MKGSVPLKFTREKVMESPRDSEAEGVIVAKLGAITARSKFFVAEVDPLALVTITS